MWFPIQIYISWDESGVSEKKNDIFRNISHNGDNSQLNNLKIKTHVLKKLNEDVSWSSITKLY